MACRPDALTPFLTDTDPEIRAQAAKVLGHARTAAAAAALVPLVQDANPRVRYFATVALGRIGHRPAMPAVVAMLAADKEQDVYLRSAAVVALTGFGDRAALASLATHASRGVRLAAVVALRRLQDAGVARFLDDADPLVVTEAAGAINDEGGIVAALPALARVLERPGISGEPLVRRAISANLRVGDAAAVARVAAYARRAGLPEPLRVEAISTLGVWAAPSNMDRVDGSWIAPLPQREASAAQAAVTELASLMTDPAATPAVKVAWIEAVAKLGVKSQAGAILARLQSDPQAPVRVAALGCPPDTRGAGARTWCACGDGRRRHRRANRRHRGAAGDAAGGAGQGRTAELGGGQGQHGRTAERRSRPRRKCPATKRFRRSGVWPTAWRPARWRPRSSSICWRRCRPPRLPRCKQRLDQLKVGRDLANLGTVFPDALTTGGSPLRGRQIALQHAAAQCGRCHAIGDSKADVGPALAGVGSRLTRQQLLESLITPSARLAPGYGQVSVTLKNGQKVEGTLREESATAIAIEDHDAGAAANPGRRHRDAHQRRVGDAANEPAADAA